MNKKPRCTQEEHRARLIELLPKVMAAPPPDGKVTFPCGHWLPCP